MISSSASSVPCKDPPNFIESLPTYQNMAIKMNAKMRGMNHALLKNSTSGDKKAGWLELHPAMIFGNPALLPESYLLWF